MGNVERGRPQVAVANRPVEGGEAIVRGRDARRERDQVVGARVGVADVELHAVAEPLLDLTGKRVGVVTAAIGVSQHIVDGRQDAAGCGGAARRVDGPVQRPPTLPRRSSHDAPQVYVPHVELVEAARVQKVKRADDAPRRELPECIAGQWNGRDPAGDADRDAQRRCVNKPMQHIGPPGMLGGHQCRGVRV